MHVFIVNNTVIPAAQYGGTERVIWWLGKELIRLGHKVTYLVKDGSSCPFANVLTLDQERPITDQVPEYVDFVHLHFQIKEKLSKPYLITHHGNFHPDKEYDINTVFVSKDHANRNGSDIYVHNGLDPEEYGSIDLDVPGEYLLFLGYAKRPEKNLKDCVYIARKTKHVLHIIGGNPKWFKWRPWLQYRGFVGGEEKNEIMRRSKALLFPIRWHEPFGLAVIESLYFGRPVFGSNYGALPELVPKEVGFLSNNRSELAKAVKQIDSYDPGVCHNYCLEHFSAKIMTQNYLKLYEQVLSGKTLNEKAPINEGNFDRNNLLPIYS